MRTSYLLPLPFLAFAAVLVFILRTPIRALIIQPVWNFLVLARAIVLSLPQQALWILLIVYGSVLLVRAVLSFNRDRYDPPEFSPAPEGPLSRWSRTLHQASGGDYFSWRAATELSRLSLEWFAHTEGTSLDEIQDQLTSGELNIEPRIREFIMRGLQARPFEQDIGKSPNFDRDEFRNVIKYLENLVENDRES